MKNCLILLLSLLCFGSLQSQVTLTLSEESIDQNGTAEIDVTVDGFQNISGTNFSIIWNSSIMSFSSIKNLSEDLPGLNASAFGTPENAHEPGQLTFNWFEPTGNASVDLNDGTRLFTLALTAVGSPCDSTGISLSDIPKKIEIFDFDLNVLNVTSNDGYAKINGTDCSGNGGDDKIGLIAGNIDNAEGGTEICVPISVKNFAEIQSISSGIEWNPSVLEYVGPKNFQGLPGFDANFFNITEVSSGLVEFIWTDPTGETPISLTDGTVIFEICFNVIGNNGSSSDISFIESDFTDPMDQSLPYENVAGSVTVNGDGGGSDKFTLEIDKVEASMGTEVCVDVKARNFTDISNMQYAVEFDNTILEFTKTQNYNLDFLSQGNFNLETPSKIRTTWNILSGTVDVADNTILYQMCFNIIGDCEAGGTSNLDFINDGNFNIQIVKLINNELIELTDLNLVSGSVTLASCGVNYQVLSSIDVACHGESNGSITVAVSGGSDDCECAWTDVDGNTISSGTIGGNNCSLLGQRAGTYTFAVTCTGEEVFSTTETISEPDPILISGVVDNVACGEMGAIDLNISGGSPNYTFSWNPDLGNQEDHSNLAPGTYAVTVTDANNCTEEATFEVMEGTDDVSISDQNVTDASCNGEPDGSIAITVDGGCTDNNGNYTIVWKDSDGMDVGTGVTLGNLSGGMYTVVITDSSNPPLTLSQEIMVGQPAAINIVANTVPATDGNNGAIQLSVTGGAGSYSYSWTPDQGNTDNPAGLSAGEYSVTVTDANGCTNSTTVTVNAGGASLSNVTADSGSCSSNCEGMITGTLTAGVTPVILTLSDGPTTGSTTLNQPGNFTFENLCPGTYILTASDANGEAVMVNNLEIIESDAIVIDFESTCTEEDDFTGSIDLVVTGGSGSFDYLWSNGATTQDINNLSRGTYSVLVTDQNGCEAMMNDILVDFCNIDCFEASSILTPNGDGANDLFNIACLEGLDNRLGVYDRSGIRVFESVNYDNSWDGTNVGGDPLPEGSYMWALEVDFGTGGKEVFKGTVTLLRDF